ncbi:MAG: hypothetical protein KC910_04275 [Candidatus Eremiobacteraeota bacterium]|nr:hypothetical protein [Candidatus Eremiobacteraeota bacterium]
MSLHKVIRFGLYALIGLGFYDRWQQARRQSDESAEPSRPADPRVRVTRESLGNGYEVMRFRGRYDQVMDALHNRPAAKPPALPEDLDLDTLKKYHCGCPHCGSRSLYGQSLWFYQELSRTRGSYDNTTTYLARCKSCQGLMQATIDHDD